MTVDPPFTTRPELSGTFGMVASTHWLASAAGMATLEAGGNAFDAAAAAGLALQVVEPQFNGPAGDLPLLLYDVRLEAPLVICGQGPAPAAATPERFRDLGLDLVPGTGLLAACVPGAFDAWMLLLRDHGTLRLADVLRYAIGYAEDGFPALPTLAGAIARVAPMFVEEWTSSAKLWLARGRPPAPGTRLRNPLLATTYRRILAAAEARSRDREEQIEAARDAFLRGFVAEEIAAFAETAEALDASGRRHRALLTGEDLAAYRASVEAPVTFDYEGWTVCKTGPWGQGPVLLQQLALLEARDLGAMDPVGADYVHTVVECAKLALADRDAWYGDSADVPLDGLLSRAYAAVRGALVDPLIASAELRPGVVDGREPRLPTPLRTAEAAAAAMAGVGEPALSAPSDPLGDTCHVDVADRHGNVISATPSGGWLQSSPAIPGLGFCLGTRAQMTWPTEGLASSLAPGRRPRTTLSPSLALRDGGAERLVWGTPGGDQQDQWSLAFFLGLVHHGRNLQEAIDAPAFHTMHFPSSFYPRAFQPRRVDLEARFGPGVVTELRRRGHHVEVMAPWSIGRLSAVSRSADGVLRGAANPRGMQGYAIGR
jgi:gamma-glutamyltranspeptidase / glutathione hydrolase